MIWGRRWKASLHFVFWISSQNSTGRRFKLRLEQSKSCVSEVFLKGFWSKRGISISLEDLLLFFLLFLSLWWPWNSKLRRFFLSLPWVKLCLALVDGRFVCPCEPGGTHSFESTWAHKTRPLVPTYPRRSVTPGSRGCTKRSSTKPRRNLTRGRERNFNLLAVFKKWFLDWFLFQNFIYIWNIKLRFFKSILKINVLRLISQPHKTFYTKCNENK